MIVEVEGRLLKQEGEWGIGGTSAIENQTSISTIITHVIITQNTSAFRKFYFKNLMRLPWGIRGLNFGVPKVGQSGVAIFANRDKLFKIR